MPVAAKNPDGEARAQQRGRRINRASNSEEGNGSVGIVGRQRQEPVRVRIEDSNLYGAPAFDGGQGEIGAGGHQPRRISDSGGGSVRAAGQIWGVVSQAVAKCVGLEGGDGHALPVDGVEAAHRVADQQEAVREAALLLVAPPYVGGESERDRVVDRLAGVDDVTGQAGRSHPTAAASGDDRDSVRYRASAIQQSRWVVCRVVVLSAGPVDRPVYRRYRGSLSASWSRFEVISSRAEWMLSLV
jgi:hypothetical protein